MSSVTLQSTAVFSVGISQQMTIAVAVSIGVSVVFVVCSILISVYMERRRQFIDDSALTETTEQRTDTDGLSEYDDDDYEEGVGVGIGSVSVDVGPVVSKKERRALAALSDPAASAARVERYRHRKGGGSLTAFSGVLNKRHNAPDDTDSNTRAIISAAKIEEEVRYETEQFALARDTEKKLLSVMENRGKVRTGVKASPSEIPQPSGREKFVATSKLQSIKQVYSIRRQIGGVSQEPTLPAQDIKDTSTSQITRPSTATNKKSDKDSVAISTDSSKERGTFLNRALREAALASPATPPLSHTTTPTAPQTPKQSPNTRPKSQAQSPNDRPKSPPP